MLGCQRKGNKQMDKYEIHIGQVIDSESLMPRPKQVFIITRDQFAIIEQFASTRKDEELNTWYKLNDCEFRVWPHFELDK